MSLNFIIVEGSTNTHDLDDIYEDFKKDYLNPRLTADQVRRKHDLEPRDYKTLGGRVRDETGLKKKPVIYDPLVNENMNIYELKHCYGVRKYLNGGLEYFGYYPDVETARMVRDKLYECNWDRSVAEELYQEYGVHKGNHHGMDISYLLPEFKHLYADVPTHTTETCKRLKIGYGTYGKLLRMLREEYPNIKKNRVPRDKESYNISHRPNRYIARNGDYYSVVKHDKSYGTFKRLEDAVNHRNKLEVTGWV